MGLWIGPPSYRGGCGLGEAFVWTEMDLNVQWTLLQIGAQQSGEPPGTLDAGHVLRRWERHLGQALAVAHPYQPDANQVCPHACRKVPACGPHAAHQGDCTRPHLPRRFRCYALPDVSSGRRSLDRREREFCRSSRTRTSRFGSGRRIFRLPNHLPKSTLLFQPAR